MKLNEVRNEVTRLNLDPNLLVPKTNCWTKQGAQRLWATYFQRSACDHENERALMLNLRPDPFFFQKGSLDG